MAPLCHNELNARPLHVYNEQNIIVAADVPAP